MNKTQISLLKEAYFAQSKRADGSKSTTAESVIFGIDGGTQIITSKDFVLFDDTNELIHGIALNDNMVSQASYPVKIISAEYAIIQTVEGVLTRANFEKLLKSGYFSGLVTGAKGDMLRAWISNANFQAQQPLDVEPYFDPEEDNEIIIQMPHTRKERPVDEEDTETPDIPEEPKDPTDPDDPTDPENPDDPKNPTDPENPEKPTNPEGSGDEEKENTEGEKTE